MFEKNNVTGIVRCLRSSIVLTIDEDHFKQKNTLYYNIIVLDN